VPGETMEAYLVGSWGPENAYLEAHRIAGTANFSMHQQPGIPRRNWGRHAEWALGTVTPA